MFGFDKIDMQRVAISSFGALALTTACIGAAVAPARAATAPVSAEQWKGAVETMLATRADQFALDMQAGDRAEAVVAVRFNADGVYEGAQLVRSSGRQGLDAHAVKLAGRIRYPAMPESLRGKPQTVAMRLVFGRADTAVQYADMTKDLQNDTRLARNSVGGSQIVAK